MNDTAQNQDQVAQIAQEERRFFNFELARNSLALVNLKWAFCFYVFTELEPKDEYEVTFGPSMEKFTREMSLQTEKMHEFKNQSQTMIPSVFEGTWSQLDLKYKSLQEDMKKYYDSHPVFALKGLVVGFKNNYKMVGKAKLILEINDDAMGIINNLKHCLEDDYVVSLK